jgi:hypothetical protein
LSKKKKKESLKDLKNYPNLSREEKDSQSLDDIFPDLDSRPKEIVEQEKIETEALKRYFPTLKSRVKSISEIPLLVKTPKFTSSELKTLKRNFFEQLENSESVALSGWKLIPYLLENKVLTKDDVRVHRKFLFNLLKSSDKKIRADSWWQVAISLAPYNLVTNEEIIKYKKYIFELRGFPMLGMIGQVEVILQDFIDRGIITEEEYMNT